MTLYGAISNLVMMREHPMMPSMFYSSLDKIIETVSECEEPETNYSEIPNSWIPCSERMPDEHEWLGTKTFGTTISDEVYVTFENPKGERFCKHLSFQNKKLSDYDQHTIDVFYKGSKPIAWMPLPEPYQPKEYEL